MVIAKLCFKPSFDWRLDVELHGRDGFFTVEIELLLLCVPEKFPKRTHRGQVLIQVPTLARQTPPCDSVAILLLQRLGQRPHLFVAIKAIFAVESWPQGFGAVTGLVQIVIAGTDRLPDLVALERNTHIASLPSIGLQGLRKEELLDIDASRLIDDVGHVNDGL